MQINKNNQAGQMLTLIKFELNFSCHLGGLFENYFMEEGFSEGRQWA